MVKYAAVVFYEGGKEYSYRSKVEDLESGEKIIVDGRGGPKFAIFVRYIDPTPIATAWIVGRREDIEKGLPVREKSVEQDTPKPKMVYYKGSMMTEEERVRLIAEGK